jgi:pimeloyl-ACP methyl ester carboxylesterase
MRRREFRMFVIAMLLGLFGAFVFGLYSFLFVLSLFYWYESINHPCPEIPAKKLSLPALFVFAGHSSYGILANMSAFVVHYATRLLPQRGTKARGSGAAADAPLPPVICVHGLWHRAPGWFYMRRAMAKAGFTRSAVFSYQSYRYRQPDQIVPLLEKAVAAMEQRCPGEKPLLVGHSMGGIIIRCWLGIDGNETRVGGVLTLGTPHRGSSLAALAFGRLGRSLLPANPFFAALTAAERKRPFPCVSLVTACDEMVLPQKNLIPPGPGWELRITPTCSHVGMIFRPAAMRMAVWELSRMAAGGGNETGRTEQAG